MRLSRNIHALLVRQPRLFHTSPSILKSKPTNHTADTYQKDIDPTPPAESKIHRVDPSSENVQKPYEELSGEWSRAGSKTGEYQSVSKTEPYAAPGENQRYGGKEMYSKDKGPETSKADEGPEGKASGGRKPEGR